MIRGSWQKGAALLLALALQPAAARAQSGTWTQLITPINVETGVRIRVQDAMLMMDGSLMVEEYASQTGNWWRLTPDASGSYLNGTWTLDSRMPTGYIPLYYCSAVLPDGRLVIQGGEYNYQLSGTPPVFTYVAVETRTGALYDPKTQTWSTLPSPGTRVGDSMCSVAAIGPHKGQLMLGPNGGSPVYYLDVTTNPAAPAWVNLLATGKIGSESEEGWTLLPDGTFLDILANGTGANTNVAQRYLPDQNKWVSAGTLPVMLKDGPSHETGAQVMMYNGQVFVAGADRNSGANAVYTPPPNTDPPSGATGSWVAAPAFPRKPFAAAPPSTNCTGVAPNLMCQLDEADGPGAALVNGRVLVAAAPGIFQPNTWFFEYDPVTNTLNEVDRPPNAATKIQYQYHMVLLPTGEVFAPDGSSTVQIYTASGGPDPAWAPVITSMPPSMAPGSSHTISGLQFNGLTEGTYYGDDYASATNYPIVRFTNQATGHVFWGGTHDRDNLQIATGGVVITTPLEVPADLEHGTTDVVVIANGIASNPVEINHPPVTTASIGGTSGTNGWYVTNVQVTLTPTDPDGADDISGTKYTIDGGSAQDYSGPFPVNGDLEHQITFWSVDKSGNVETANAQTIKIDTTPPAITLTPSLASLWPPNHSMIADMMSGSATDELSGIDPATVSFHVVDEYGAVQPLGNVSVGGDGSYSFAAVLEAARLGNDRDGREYRILVAGQDRAGNAFTASTVVRVPHDQR